MGSTIIQDAVVRNLQVLAESTQRISDGVKTHYPDTEWQAISGFRNILVHDYLGLDLKLIWSVIENRLSPLRFEIEKMLEDAGQYDCHLSDFGQSTGRLVWQIL